MKATKNIFAIFLIFTSVCVNAQLKVLTNGRVNCNNQTAIYSSPSNVSDGMDIVYSNPSIPNGYDMIWGYNTTTTK